MENLKKYKSLIEDTLIYLENLDNEFLDIKNLFFKSKSQKKIKLLPENSFKISLPKEDIISTSQTQTAPPIRIEINMFPKEEKNETTIVEQKEILSHSIPPISTTPPIPIEEPKEELVQEVTQQNILETKKIKLEEKPQVIEDNFSDIKNIISKISKNITITDEILDDKIAKQKAYKYKLKNIAANLTILAYKESEKHYKFLEKLSLALNNYFYSSKVISAYVIEKENSWDTFLSENEIFLIISSDYTVFELPNLRKHYKENPSSKEKYLDKIPLFLLPDISLYLKEPSLKVFLFKTLKQKIINLKT